MNAEHRDTEFVDRDTCPTRPMLCGTCHDCRGVMPEVEKLIASRRAMLDQVKARWKRSRKIIPHEVDAVKLDLDQDPSFFRLAWKQPQCVTDAIDRGLWPLEQLADLFQAKEQRLKREREWVATVPPRYRETEIEKLPQPDVARTVLALREHAQHPPSLFLYGPSGSGKTRTAYLVAKKFFLRGGQRFNFLEASTIADVAVARARSGGMVEWCEQMVATDLVIIDEVGQGTFSNSYGEALRRILEKCTTHKIPVILTSQFDLVGLYAKWAGEDAGKGITASAIVRRIEEFLRPVRLERRPRT